MTKVLIDSLNEKQLVLLTASAATPPVGGINRLEAVLALQYHDVVKARIKVLRELQSLRSKGSAHRKGSEYLQLCQDLEMDKHPLRDVFRNLLQRSLELLAFMQEALHSGVFDSPSTTTDGSPLS